jgi:hypothetical protein
MFNLQPIGFVLKQFRILSLSISIVALVVFSCSPASDSPEKKEETYPTILSYLQQKDNVKGSTSLVLTDSKSWREKIKTKEGDLLAALKNIYFQKKLENLYVVAEKRTQEDSQEIRLPGITSKNLSSIQVSPRNLQHLHSEDDLMLYRYKGEVKSFTVPKASGIVKNIDWVNWKLIDALFPVRLHKNKKSFLTGSNSTEFIVDNRFIYFFVSKDAIFTESSKESLLILIYAQKAKEPPAASIQSCWVSLYMVDQQNKMQVLNMGEVNLDIEKQLLDDKGEWLLRAQIVQIPRHAQGIGFALRSEISLQFDDFILFVINK